MRLKFSRPLFIIYSLFIVLFIISCEDEPIPEPTNDRGIIISDFLGSYSGEIMKLRLASDGYINLDNPTVEEIYTDIIISSVDTLENGLMVYVSAYEDSILTVFDPESGYLWIADKKYSFYSRKSEFPDFDGNYDHAVTTYGGLNQSKDRFNIDFINNHNDSIYYFDTKSIKNK